MKVNIASKNHIFIHEKEVFINGLELLKSLHYDVLEWKLFKLKNL